MQWHSECLSPPSLQGQNRCSIKKKIQQSSCREHHMELLKSLSAEKHTNKILMEPERDRNTTHIPPGRCLHWSPPTEDGAYWDDRCHLATWDSPHSVPRGRGWVKTSETKERARNDTYSAFSGSDLLSSFSSFSSSLPSVPWMSPWEKRSEKNTSPLNEFQEALWPSGIKL